MSRVRSGGQGLSAPVLLTQELHEMLRLSFLAEERFELGPDCHVVFKYYRCFSKYGLDAFSFFLKQKGSNHQGGVVEVVPNIQRSGGLPFSGCVQVKASHLAGCFNLDSCAEYGGCFNLDSCAEYGVGLRDLNTVAPFNTRIWRSLPEALKLQAVDKVRNRMEESCSQI